MMYFLTALNKHLITTSIIVSLLFLGLSLNAAAFSSSEQKIGEKQHAELRDKQALYTEPKLNDYINSIGQTLVSHSSMSQKKFKFFIIDSPEINAFAAPGGYVYINRGLLAYLRNEAELAAVLAHEISHLTEKHHSRQKRAASGSKALTFLSGILTGSGEVAEAVSLYSTAAVKGFGRDMELEADGQGAKYLAAAGYPRQAMIDILSIFKNHERYSRLRAKAAGKKASSSYHGLFSSHPRNDKRLHQLVKTNIQQATSSTTNLREFRKQINGLPFGNNYSNKTVGAINSAAQLPKSRNGKTLKRYLNPQLGLSFLHPELWQVNAGKTAITVTGPALHQQAPKQKPQLSLGAKASNKQTPEQFLRKNYKVGLLQQSEPLVQASLIGHTGTISDSNKKKQQRLAVFYRGRIAYLFTSQWQLKDEFSKSDADYLTIIRSFRPERRMAKSRNTGQQRIHFVKANAKTRFASLAKQAGLGQSGADQLRLINGYYPSGEPRPGEVIKIIH